MYVATGRRLSTQISCEKPSVRSLEHGTIGQLQERGLLNNSKTVS